MAPNNENCLNPTCDSVNDLRKTTRMLCDYFNVKYKQSIKVCASCRRKYLKYTIHQKKTFKAVQGLTFNYDSYSIVRSEKKKNTISAPVDILVQRKNKITGTEAIKENETTKHDKNYKCRLNDITADSSINKIEVMKKSSNCKFCLSLAKQKNKSNICAHKKCSYKNSSNENVIKLINIKNTPIGDIIKSIKIKRSIHQHIQSSPKITLSPKQYVLHECNNSCVEWTDYDQNKTKQINMLAIPLYFGFKRHTINRYGIHKSITYYETPCGVSIQNMEEMMHYLNVTKSKMTIDQFDFTSYVNPLPKYHVSKPIKFLKDISKGLEFRPITCVNSINDELPPKIKYITKRQATEGVNINVDPNFLCGCDCTDNCQDKSKCACWQITINEQSKMPNVEKNLNVGYNYRRLYAKVQTGIYECNDTCKCNNSCLNRVVQQPISNNLQLFKTKKKGWGVRCLNDIPQGTFICCYIGKILTEINATKQGKSFGDEYLADLDFVEVNEGLKKGYEEDAFSSQEDAESQKSSENSLDLFNKLIHDKHTVSSDVVTFSESNYVEESTHFQDDYRPQKSIRSYYDDNNSVYTINAKSSGNIGRFFNHSCSPNLFVQNVFVDTHDLRFPWISYFSEHFIPAGTELTWNYGYEIGSIPGKVVACYCNSDKCKGRLI